MSIGRLFNLCMVAAALIVVVVAGQVLVREAADYRARSRAIDAGNALDDLFDVMAKGAAERAPTFSLLASEVSAADDSNAATLQLMRAQREKTVQAIAMLRRKVALLDDSRDIPPSQRVDFIVTNIDAIESERKAIRALIDQGLAQPRITREPGLAKAYAAADLKLNQRFTPLLNALQARIALGSPNAAAIVQIVRYLADLREQGGLQPSLVNAAFAEGRPFTAQELRSVDRVQGEVDRLRILIEASIAYIGDPPALVELWHEVLAGYFGRRRAIMEEMFKHGASDGQYPMPLSVFIPTVNKEWDNVIRLREQASHSAIEAVTQSRDEAWNRVLAAGSELLLVAAAVSGLIIWFRRQVVVPLMKLASKIMQLAEGRRDLVIDMIDRRDEVGGIARATEVFHAALIEREQLTVDLRAEIAERGKAEAARAELQDQLLRAKKMEAIGTVAGGVAHELNNLLQPILMLAEVLIDHFPEGDQISREDMALIIDHAQRARDIVSSIVTFARKRAADVGALDVAREMRGVDAMLRSLVPATVKIEKQIAPESCLVMANRTELMQVVTNLVINASHAMNQSGSLKIALEHTALDATMAAELHVAPGDYADLSITDTGSGIEPGLLERIFEPFFTTKPAGQGTGLGLSVVYGIVRAWKGAMRVQSEVGRGTTFSVLVPMLPS
jgi:signal transduction histidine kinase